MASRVVPGSEPTRTRSNPRMALTKDDLPTLGRPITARRTRFSSAIGSSLSGKWAMMASFRAWTPLPWRAETGQGDVQAEPVILNQDFGRSGVIDFINRIDDGLGSLT